MGLAHELLGKTDLDQLFIMDPLTPLSVHSITAGRKKCVKASHLSKIWGIDIETARRTLEVTTQLRQQDTRCLSRNFSKNDRMLQYKRINCDLFTYTYFVTRKAKSTRGNTMMQLFSLIRVLSKLCPRNPGESSTHPLRCLLRILVFQYP